MFSLEFFFSVTDTRNSRKEGVARLLKDVAWKIDQIKLFKYIITAIGTFVLIQTFLKISLKDWYWQESFFVWIKQ